MVKAGYSPEGAVQLQEYFYRQLEGGKNPMWAEGLFRTHPFSKERLDNARARIAERYPDTVKNPNYTLNGTIFLQKTARLREAQKAYDILRPGGQAAQGEAVRRGAGEVPGGRRKMEPGQAPFHSSAGSVYLIRKNDRGRGRGAAEGDRTRRGSFRAALPDGSPALREGRVPGRDPGTRAEHGAVPDEGRRRRCCRSRTGRWETRSTRKSTPTWPR